MVKKLLPACFAAIVFGVAFFGTLQTTTANTDTVLISGVYYDTYLPFEPDESFRLINASNAAISLNNWTVTDQEGVITLTGSIDPGASLWVAKTAISFTQEFGFNPAFEFDTDSTPLVPNLPVSGTFALGNSGDQLVLKDNTGAIVDSVVWETGGITNTNWSGPAVQPYSQGFFGIEGQILYRKLDQTTGRPVADTNTVADWAQATDDNILGKKVLYPGWELDRYFQTAKFTETATLTYTVAPDGIYTTVLSAIQKANTSIRYEGYDFQNAELGQALAVKASQGVSVKVLLEGGPVGGITNQEKWICQQIETSGGQCWFMVNNDTITPTVEDRYAYQHAKFMIIDNKWLLSGSENLNYTSMPSDGKADGTLGNRGLWLWTDSPSAIAHANDVFTRDTDTKYRDIQRWSAGDPTYGAPSGGFSPSFGSGGTAYPAPFQQPIVISGPIYFELVQSPENSLRSTDSLLGMVARAGNGDKVLVEQLYENKYWGPANSNPTADPNPRLEGYIAAARRGASVSILLDSFYDDAGDPRSNSATCVYVNSIAISEGVDLQCLLGNPTGTGIHNKMVLVLAGGQGWVHTGSLNGSENSSKNNREFAIQVRSTTAYNALAEVFWYDWTDSGGSGPIEAFVYLPMMMKNYAPPTPTPTRTPTPTLTPIPTLTYTPSPTVTPVPGTPNLVIWALSGLSIPEFVEIRNIGTAAQNMTGWTLVSVVGPQTFPFPGGYVLAPNTTVRIESFTGAGNNPPAVLWWANSAIWNNSGDKAELRNASDQIVATQCYGSGCP